MAQDTQVDSIAHCQPAHRKGRAIAALLPSNRDRGAPVAYSVAKKLGKMLQSFTVFAEWQRVTW